MKDFVIFLCVAFWAFLSAATATIPPHSKSSSSVTNRTAETDYANRRILESPTKNYTTLLNPDLCRFEDDETCHRMDRSLYFHAQETVQLVQTTGKLNVLVILMQFSNHELREVPSVNDIATLFNYEGRGEREIVPTGSIKAYFRLNSHNNLEIDATVLPWQTVGFSEQECLFGNSGMDKDFQKCFWPILDLLDLVHRDPDNPFDWGEFDTNGDGYIDSVVVLHSGYGAEWGGTDPDGKDAENRIWSHSNGPQPDRWRATSIELGSFSVTSAFRGHSGNKIAGIGLIAHEIIHTLGIPDLFDKSREDQDGGIGAYSIMSNPWGQGDDSTKPGHLDPWSKLKLDWISPKPIKRSGSYAMRPSEVEPDIYIIDHPYPEGEYLLIEHRQPLWFDENLWTKGALIWHIDDKVVYTGEAGGTYQGSEWPENGKHYRVALIQADGKFGLEQAINVGHADDFHTEGSSLKPGNMNTVFPNTDSYQGGLIQETGITISGFSINGLELSFSVTGMPDFQDETTNLSQCLLNINVGLCDGRVESIETPADCDCWSICGNGISQQCCKFGEPCSIDCNSGGLISGCRRTEASGADFNTPGSESGLYKPWGKGDEILVAVTPGTDSGTMADSSTASRSRSVAWSLVIFLLMQLL